MNTFQPPLLPISSFNSVDFLENRIKKSLKENLHICVSMYFREWSKFMSRCRLLCMARFVWKIRIFVYLDNLRDIATFFSPKELRKNNNLDIYNSKFSFAFCEKEQIFHFPNAQALCCERSYCLRDVMRRKWKLEKLLPCALCDCTSKLVFIIIARKTFRMQLVQQSFSDVFFVLICVFFVWKFYVGGKKLYKKFW